MLSSDFSQITRHLQENLMSNTSTKKWSPLGNKTIVIGVMIIIVISLLVLREGLREARNKTNQATTQNATSTMPTTATSQPKDSLK